MSFDEIQSDLPVPYRQKLEKLFDQRYASDIEVDLSVKEVYAHFGLAYYESEVLHRGLCTLYVFSGFSSRDDITGPRASRKGV